MKTTKLGVEPKPSLILGFLGTLFFSIFCSNFATPSNISSFQTTCLEILCTSNQGSISDIRCDLSAKINADQVDTWTKTQWLLEDWVDGLKK